MERNQFTFYASFYKTISRIKAKAARADAYDAICRYALTGEMPDLASLPDTAAMVLDMAIPVLDSGSKRAASGRKGGSKSQANGKQNEAKPKQNEREIEGEIEIEKEGEIEKEIEIENECSTPTPTPPPAAEGFGEVMSFYMDHINPVPTGVCVDALKAYTQRLSAPVVLHVLQLATDDRKTAWSYISAILQRYQRDGLDSLEKVAIDERDRAEEKERREAERNQPAWKRGRNAPATCKPRDVSAELAALEAALDGDGI